MSRYVRAGVALSGVAALLLAVAAPAAADPSTGKVDSTQNKLGYQVNIGDGWLSNLPTSLIGFKLDDGTVLGVYCVDLETEIDEERTMVEQPWDEFPNPDSPFNENQKKINWVLHHGFPVLNQQQLAEQLPSPPNDGIDELEAIAATQAAVWHFSDGVDLDQENPLTGGAADEEDVEDVLALYNFLTGDENTGVEETPLPELTIDPADQNGQVGTKIGPFTVNTNATVEELKAELPEGVLLTDGAGNEVDAGAIEDGTQLFVEVPEDIEDGDGTFELTASATVDTGRLFVGENYDETPTQAVIVAAAVTTTLTAKAGAAWSATPPEETTTTTTTTEAPAETTSSTTPAPQGGVAAEDDDLAQTGASIGTPIVIGLVLVGAGVIAMLVMRRRRA